MRPSPTAWLGSVPRDMGPQENEPQTLNSLVSADCAQAYGLILGEHLRRIIGNYPPRMIKTRPGVGRIESCLSRSWRYWESI